MKRTLIVLIYIFTATYISIAQDDPDSIIDEFFKSVQQKEYLQAIQTLPLSSKLRNDTIFINTLAGKLQRLNQESGDYCGYELIEKKDISPSFLSYSYLIKYLHKPNYIRFVFYMPIDKWRVNNVSLNTQDRSASRRRNTGFKAE